MTNKSFSAAVSILFLIPVLFSFSITSAATQDFAREFFSGSEPDERIRSIAWGTNLTELRDMEFIEEGKQYEETKEFGIKGQTLLFSDLQLQDIRYCFWKGLLYRVKFVTNGTVNWTKLKAIVGKRYPQFLQPTEIEVFPGLVTKVEVKNRRHFSFGDMEIDELRGEHVSLWAEYRASFERGVFVIESMKMIHQIEKAEGQVGRDTVNAGLPPWVLNPGGPPVMVQQKGRRHESP